MYAFLAEDHQAKRTGGPEPVLREPSQTLG